MSVLFISSPLVSSIMPARQCELNKYVFNKYMNEHAQPATRKNRQTETQKRYVKTRKSLRNNGKEQSKGQKSTEDSGVLC